METYLAGILHHATIAEFVTWLIESRNMVKVISHWNLAGRTEVFCKKGVLKNFAKLTRKHLCQSLLFNKVADMRPETCNFIKKRLCYRCFPLNFEKFPRTSFLTVHLRWLLKVKSL